MLELACGVRPFLFDKFDITNHKNYKLLEDYDKKNLFDVEAVSYTHLDVYKRQD